jgi:hypothetical protein
MRQLARTLWGLGALLLAAAPAASAATSPDPGRLDGVTIEAVESYLNENHHDLALGVGLLPFNSYYNGFSLNGGYTYFFTKSVGWEVVGGSYVYTVKTDLSSELAEDYGVNPEKIERVKFLFSSSGVYSYSYGKVLLADEFIRYFRGQLLLGPGLVSTTERSAAAASVGTRFVFGVKNASSWYLEFRDLMTMTGKTEFYPAFNVGMGYGF